MNQILITGGLGYIGSHTAVELIQAGYDPILIDNLSESPIEVKDRIEKIVGQRNHLPSSGAMRPRCSRCSV